MTTLKTALSSDTAHAGIDRRDYYIAEARRMRAEFLRDMTRRLGARLRGSLGNHGTGRPAHGAA